MLAETLQNLSIPKRKNTIFISPEASRWPALLAENKLIAEDLPNRLKSRRELLRIARNYTQRAVDVIGADDDPENVIATGHQAAWHHCGIWAKSSAVCEFARAAAGNGLHLVLDHDICDTAMVVPKRDPDRSWYSEKIEIEPEQKAVALEARRPPQEDRIRTFVDAVARICPGQFCNDIWSECVAANANKISCFNSIADVITYFESVLNAALGLNMMYLPVSKLSESDAFIDFVISIMLDATGFAAAYNDAVTKQTNALRVNQRDIVQRLKLDKTTCLTELPLWLHLPDGKRTSLYVVSKTTDRIRIGTVSTPLGELDSTCPSGNADQLKSMLQQSGYGLRPKAVSLTLFVRLYLADWFVHGVGGSLYESVTDHMIENYYRMRSLWFGTATCTMTLPLANTSASATGNLSKLKHELHNIRHNPEKYIDESALAEESVVSLLRVKRERIAQTKDRSVAAGVRKSAWSSLLRINEKLLEYARDAATMMEKKIVELERNKISQETCNCREYFFGLFPENELCKLTKSLTFAEPE
jgi:hypothetical protein